jgi:16S rRNA processing protein RimM
VTLAAVAGAHGVGGAVKLKLFTDDIGPYRTFNGGALTIVLIRGNIANFREATTREAAEALRGTRLTVPRSALPPLEEGEYYHADLIGLPVVTPDGAPAGRVVAVENFGAGDVVEVERPDGRLVMLPMTADAVPDWNAERLVASPAFLD